MQILEQRAPDGIIVENHVHKADDRMSQFRNDGEVVSPRFRQTLAPDRKTVGKDVAVEEGVQVRAAIVPPPTVGVERGDRLGLAARRVALRRRLGGALDRVVSHARLHPSRKNPGEFHLNACTPSRR